MLDNLLYPSNRACSSVSDNLLKNNRLVLDNLLKNTKLGLYAVGYLQAVEQEGKSPKTLQIYKEVIESFLQYQNDHVPEPSEMRVYLLSLLQRGLQPATVHVHYRSLKTWFKWLIAENVILPSQDPMHNVKGPKIPKKIIMPFTMDEVRRILICCTGNSFLALRRRAMVLLFLDTGLRLQELTNIQRSEVDLQQGIIKVMGKGQKERMVRMGLATRTAITQYLMRRQDDYSCLWVTEERVPMTWQGLQVDTFRLARLAGIKGKRHGPHTFRHTAAALCKTNGMDIYVLQKLLGHADIKTTENYLQSLGFDLVAREHSKFSPVDNFLKP